MRQYFLWITFLLLMLLATAYLVSYAAFFANGGTATYMNQPASRPPPVPYQIITWSGYVQLVLYPCALISSAMYLLLLDRDFRRSPGRGFEIDPPL